MRKALKDTPNAQPYEDYTKLLADPKVQAVIVATPTSTHKEIVLAALAAKNTSRVKCRWPTLSTTQAIASAVR